MLNKELLLVSKKPLEPHCVLTVSSYNKATLGTGTVHGYYDYLFGSLSKKPAWGTRNVSATLMSCLYYQENPENRTAIYGEKLWDYSDKNHMPENLTITVIETGKTVKGLEIKKQDLLGLNVPNGTKLTLSFDPRPDFYL